ncbi:hypothetical protein HDV01_000009 [Terramyces sp. JEL0728]|nr:hypothetical protein HDV01_000009 [Terramyces sp. JEL0728]
MSSIFAKLHFMIEYILLDALFAVVAASTGTLSIYFLYTILIGKYVKSFQKTTGFILCFNILQTITILIWIIMYYANEAMFEASSELEYQLLNIISEIQLVLILLADIEVLFTFSVLYPKLTRKRLVIFRYVVLILYLLFPFSTKVLSFFVYQERMAVISNMCILVYAMFGVLYDNVQNFGLLYAIYQFKQSKLQSPLSYSTVAKFRELVVYIVLMIVIDWTGVLLNLYATISVSIYAKYFNLASTQCESIHILGMIVCLLKLTELSLSGTDENTDNSERLKKLADLKLPNIASMHNQPTAIICAEMNNRP